MKTLRKLGSWDRLNSLGVGWEETWDELTRNERIHLLWPDDGLVSPIGELQITALAQRPSRYFTPANRERVLTALETRNDHDHS